MNRNHCISNLTGISCATGVIGIGIAVSGQIYLDILIQFRIDFLQHSQIHIFFHQTVAAGTGILTAMARIQQKHFIIEIRKNADRLLSLINDILRLSEMDRNGNELALETLDLYDIAVESMEAFSVSADKKNITIAFYGEHCDIRGNREMIRELVDNLVQNAIRYNNENGKVWVTVKVAGSPMLIVKDNGIGIPAADRERVFERFYRVDKSRSKATGGTGLGLAIVKHIVEIHDAKIELNSEIGKGTEITVRF